MSNLISRENLIKAIKDKYNYASATAFLLTMRDILPQDVVYQILAIIDNAPTVKPEKVLFANVTFDEDKLKEIVQAEVIDKIKSGELVLKGEWIPVSERLPEKNMACLVAVGKINLTQIAVYSDLMGTINREIFYQGDYGHKNFEDITQYVNAWQPLPEPYKKGGAE